MIGSDDDSFRPDAPPVWAPDWWAEVYDRRQFDLRERILRIVREGPKIAWTGGSFALSASNFDRREVDAALESLVADGLIEPDGDRYRLPKGGAS